MIDALIAPSRRRSKVRVIKVSGAEQSWAVVLRNSYDLLCALNARMHLNTLRSQRASKLKRDLIDMYVSTMYL
jgi:hypothetical protein